ncbi:VPS4-associated protein 1 [Boletus edulis BED1]|uniref:VPS4-associated protein 1 n=1 Tax=Boletus edulis BED1 TaxID=1328754 RepID=A0AAD4C6S9_BOLED|nr:VPS4-associated protein 1 [Boletus edulis BED1]
MVFPNLYYKRTAATAKACYICYKPTVTVLATIDTADFFYTCPTHLTDHGFATRAPDPEPEPKKPSVSPEEIAKVKEEWERKQRQKKDKEGQADGDGKNGAEGAPKDAEGKEADVGTKADSKQEKKPVVAQGSSTEEPTARPTHERYILHRDIFSLRTADHRRRRQAAQTKNLAPRLPGAPRGSLQ